MVIQIVPLRKFLREVSLLMTKSAPLFVLVLNYFLVSLYLRNIIIVFFCLNIGVWGVNDLSAQVATSTPNHTTDDHTQSTHEGETHADEHSPAAGESHGVTAHKKETSYTDMMMDHISNSNEFHLFGHTSIPLPCIFYTQDEGVHAFMSSEFEHGHKAVKGFVLDNGVARRILNPAQRSIEHIDYTEREGDKIYAVAHGEKIELEKASTLIGKTSWYDFSISKNVFTMLLSALILCIIFLYVASKYKKSSNIAPNGAQNFFEVFLVFLRDDVVKPSIGEKWEKFFPFVCSVFFFILLNNLLGIVPFFPGGANVTGNIGTTMVLALFTFIIVTLNGTKDYWMHILWMPGVPWAVKLLLTPIEIAGIFIKPFTLMVRLFANIAAGHIIILSLIGLIFIMGKNGTEMGGAITGGAIGVPFVFAMNFLELFVAFLQAFIFALLTSLYIGAAVETHAHDDHH